MTSSRSSAAGGAPARTSPAAKASTPKALRGLLPFLRPYRIMVLLALLALVDTADVFIHSVRPQKLEKLGLGPEECETVEWLVRYHLLMSDMAQKRDIGDPRTVRDFAKAQGWISGYEILINANKRPGEPDYYLVTRFPRFADKAEEKKRDEAYDAYMKQTVAEAQAGSAERAKYRTQMGSQLLRALRRREVLTVAIGNGSGML